MKVAVIQFPGSNCDDDARYALAGLGAEAVMIWHRERDLKGAGAVVIPGGFSYGDYLRSGALAALSPVMDSVRAFAARGGPVVGICNGFQILTEAGLLPGQLARNPSLHFLCQTVMLRVERSDTAFTRGYTPGQLLRLPIAHNEGSYYADRDMLARLEGDGLVIFRYADAQGELSAAANVNQSLHSIAGIVSESGNVLGMMPHPERATEPLLGSADGLPLLRALLEAGLC
ncbi:MAG: phosphoribosylformylglycinamidine synthase subunit PurQ [Truepera sp.]|nr:phosphoribosylformylglycinamidine synthase subunit PurQ [Truepera sp.]